MSKPKPLIIVAIEVSKEMQASSDKFIKLQSNLLIGVFLISFETIVGKQVIGTGGFIIGEVKGALIDTKTWQVPQLYIKLSDNAANELGFKKRFRSSTVCLPTKMIQAVGDIVTIAPPLKELSESHEITEYKP